jgi:hypothetical protein
MLQRLHIISAMKLYMVKYYYNAMNLYIFKCNETMMPLPSPLDVGDCLIFHNSRASLH